MAVTIEQSLKPKREASAVRDNSKAPEKRFAIPYVPGLTEGLKRIFRKVGKNVVMKPMPNLRSRLRHLKDRSCQRKSTV